MNEVKELTELKNEFYEVMYKYEKSFSEEGVMANLTAWQTAKADLLSLLRRHPNWNEDEQAIIFDCNQALSIQTDMVDETASRCWTSPLRYSAVSSWRISAQHCMQPCQVIAAPFLKKIWRSYASAAGYAVPKIRRPAALLENSARNTASIDTPGTTPFLHSLPTL